MWIHEQGRALQRYAPKLYVFGLEKMTRVTQHVKCQSLALTTWFGPFCLLACLNSAYCTCWQYAEPLQLMRLLLFMLNTEHATIYIYIYTYTSSHHVSLFFDIYIHHIRMFYVIMIYLSILYYNCVLYTHINTFSIWFWSSNRFTYEGILLPVKRKGRVAVAYSFFRFLAQMILQLS